MSKLLDVSTEKNRAIFSFVLFVFQDIVERRNHYWRSLAEITSPLTGKKVTDYTKEECELVAEFAITLKDVVCDGRYNMPKRKDKSRRTFECAAFTIQDIIEKRMTRWCLLAETTSFLTGEKLTDYSEEDFALITEVVATIKDILFDKQYDFLDELLQS